MLKLLKIEQKSDQFQNLMAQKMTYRGQSVNKNGVLLTLTINFYIFTYT